MDGDEEFLVASGRDQHRRDGDEESRQSRPGLLIDSRPKPEYHQPEHKKEGRKGLERERHRSGKKHRGPGHCERKRGKDHGADEKHGCRLLTG